MGWFVVTASMLVLLAPDSGRAAPTPGAIEQPTVEVRSLAPGQGAGVPYWPFAPYGGTSTPTLARVDVDAVLPPQGCGAFTWSVHPVAASKAPGPFCVGVLEGTAVPLLVVGRPGAAPYILVPGEVSVGEDADGARSVSVGQPATPLPALVDAVRAWVAALGRRP